MIVCLFFDLIVGKRKSLSKKIYTTQCIKSFYFKTEAFEEMGLILNNTYEILTLDRLQYQTTIAVAHSHDLTNSVRIKYE